MMATTTVGQLREQVQGETITAEDRAYEEARRVYNAMIDWRPSVIVRCGGADDVVAAVNFARESGLGLAVRGGSHSVPGFGTADDAVVIDLSRMQAVEVDPAASTARGQGGATWGAFNDATHAHGLATTGGIISTTGIGGLTRRRDRVPQPRLWPVLRQSAVGASRHGGWPDADRQRAGERGSVLGDSRRRGQLRRRHLVRISGAPGPGDLRWPDALRTE